MRLCSRPWSWCENSVWNSYMSYNQERPHEPLVSMLPGTYRAQLQATSFPLEVSR